MMNTAQRPTPTRTRIVGKQSKNGCYTCKIRRIKCDETRPSCLRCARSKRECDGYRDSAPPKAEETVSRCVTPNNQPSTALSPFQDRDTESARFASLACTALMCGNAVRSNLCSAVWSIDLPQMNLTTAVVSHALAALGAAMEVEVVSGHRRQQARTAFLKHYGSALHSVQQDICQAQDVTEPLLVACLILASADIVQWQEGSALVHLQGSLDLLRRRRKTLTPKISPGKKADQKLDASRDDTSTFAPQDELDVIAVLVDLQAASYILGQPPRLPEIDSTAIQNIADGLHHSPFATFGDLIRIMHTSYTVALLVGKYKYMPAPSAPQEVTLEQGRQLGLLEAFMERLTNGDLSSTHQTGLDMKQVALLRCLCFATYIYLAMVSCPWEKGWDNYAPLFQQLIDDAQVVLGATGDSLSPYEQFSPGVGVLQPLFLAATKYREPWWRRRAIMLLQRGGREGPWHGPSLAATAARAVEIEEDGFDRSCGWSASLLQESKRLSGIGLDFETLASGGGGFFNVHFSRCRDVEQMLTTETSWDDDAHWKAWIERLPLRSRNTFDAARQEQINTASPMLEQPAAAPPLAGLASDPGLIFSSGWYRVAAWPGSMLSAQNGAVTEI